MKRTVAFAFLALTLAACSSSTHHTAAPIASVAPTSTTTSVDPTVIPPIITVDYLNAVLARLDHVYGDAVREFVSRRDVTQAVNIRLRAIYNDPLYQEQLKVFSMELAQGLADGFANVQKPPGDRVTRVTHVFTTSPSCIWMETSTDLSAVVVQPQDVAQSEYLAIRRRQPGNDPDGFNPTPWALDANFTYKSVTPQPADPCANR